MSNPNRIEHSFSFEPEFELFNLYQTVNPTILFNVKLELKIFSGVVTGKRDFTMTIVSRVSDLGVYGR